MGHDRQLDIANMKKPNSPKYTEEEGLEDKRLEDSLVNNLLRLLQSEIAEWYQGIDIMQIEHEKRNKIISKVGELLADGNF